MSYPSIASRFVVGWFIVVVCGVVVVVVVVFLGGASDTVLYKLSWILDVRNHVLKCIWFGPVYMYKSDCSSSDQCQVPV